MTRPPAGDDDVFYVPMPDRYGVSVDGMAGEGGTRAGCDDNNVWEEFQRPIRPIHSGRPSHSFPFNACYPLWGASRTYSPA